MDDEPTTSADRVSLNKRATSAPARAGSGLGGLRNRPNLAADGSPMPPPPKQVRNAALALAVSAVFALIASLSLFGEKDWLLREAKKSNAKKKVADQKDLSQLHHAVDQTATSSLVSTIVLILALAFATRGVLRGRSWSRWAVIALWVLATFTGTFAGFTYVIGIASDEPLPFKIPAFIAAAALIAAVVLVSLRPSAEYFALTKPPRPSAAGGVPPRRGGLFGPRPARPGFGAPGGASSANARPTATTRPARTGSTRDGAERSKAKQRASTEAAAKGAELARARAKASKSRRSGV